MATWLADELPARFEGSILDIDQRVAQWWGVVMVRAQRAGLTMGTMDAFLAATAHAHVLMLITRDAGDFQSAGIDVTNPWLPEN